ncbi:MAG TPA: hypothetical protein VMG12_36245 [Polyangiaceae bacterium]|nr:hypothetical protein [Polyangiaceae bacterium]
MSALGVRSGWIAVVFMLACGAAPQPGPEVPESPAADGSAGGGEAEASAEPASGPGETPGNPTSEGTLAAAPASGLPTTCAAAGDLCVPPREFVKKLCQDAYTGVALRLLEKGSPFSRGYVRSREVKAVNTLGGPSSDQPLRFEEEVLILSYTGGPGANELQVSGMGGYAVLRWDGTCATLGDEELGTRAPRSPRHAPLDWKYIDDNVQAALLKDAGVEAARRQHKKHCHGVSLGRISAECSRATAALEDSVVTAVRAGVPLPTPDRVP